MQNADAIWRLVEAKQQGFFDLSDRVWNTPEINYQEYRSSAEHAAMLEREGFRVTRGVAGLPTAIMGEFGEGGPVVWPRSARSPKAATATAAGITSSAPDRCSPPLPSRTIWRPRA